jgi:hypothetical protein
VSRWRYSVLSSRTRAGRLHSGLPPGPTASGRLTGRPLVLLKCKMPWRGCGLCQSLVLRDLTNHTPPASRKLNSSGKFRVASDRDRGSLRPRSRRRPTVTRLSEELELNRAVTPSPGSCQRLGLTRSDSNPPWRASDWHRRGRGPVPGAVTVRLRRTRSPSRTDGTVRRAGPASPT